MNISLLFLIVAGSKFDIDQILAIIVISAPVYIVQECKCIRVITQKPPSNFERLWNFDSK